MERITEAVASSGVHYTPLPPSSSKPSPSAVVMVFKERVLEAIDQLRRRKARPDLQRICNYLFRKYSIKLADARNALQWCCDTHAVRRVEYKGNISYRNATKKAASSNKIEANTNQNQNNQKGGGGERKGKFGELVTEAFGELIVFEPDYLEFGVPVDVLIDHILYKENGRYSRKYVTLLLQKEVAIGSIIRMPNGNYSIANNSCSVNSGGNGKQQEQQQNILSSNQSKIICADAEIESSNSCHSSNPSSTDVAVVRNETTANELARFKNKKKQLSTSVSHKTSVNNLDNKTIMENIYLDDKKIDSGLLRTGGRRKRAIKKVFDPSDTHVPKKRGRPLGRGNYEKIHHQDGRFNSIHSNNVSNSNLPTSNTANNLYNSSGNDFKQRSVSPQQNSGVCCVCHNNKKSPSDSLVLCRECSNRAHFSCLNSGDNMMLKMYPDNTWQCPHCKTCCVCYETSDAGGLIVCSICADGYHSNCHDPPITDKMRGNPNNWVCFNCQASENIKIDTDQHFDNKKTTNNESTVVDHSPSSPSSTLSSTHMNNYRSPAVSPTPPQLSPQTNRPESPNAVATTNLQHQIQNNNNNSVNNNNNSSDSLSNNSENDKDLDDSRCSNIDTSIPDATHWTPQQVAEYFAQFFPSEVTKVFIEQEIDGRSLLLLKRIDVLNNLNLKLGHAVKVYKHVVMLQVRRDDTNLYWL